MPLVCNKCGSAPPFGGDSWCLGCSCHEQLSLELKGAWGSQGSRAIATDLIASCLRQVRALRRLGIGAGSGAAKPPEPPGPPPVLREAAVERSASKAVSHRDRREGGPPEVKKEVEDDEDHSQESYESEEEEDEKRSEKATTPKAKAGPSGSAEVRHRDDGSERGSRRHHDHRARDSSGVRRGADTGRSRSPISREELPRRRSRTGRHHTRGSEQGHRRRRFRPGHRGGSRHQKFGRAQTDPYRRFHHQQPDSFWDQDHFNK